MTGDGRLFRRSRSPFIWMAWYVDGREYRESTKTTDETRAEKILKKRLREKAVFEETGRPFIGPDQKRVLVGELLDTFERDCELRGLRSGQKVLSHVRAVQQVFGDLRAVHVTSEAIDRYIAACLEDGYARATVNRRLQLLGQALRLGVERKLLSNAPKIRRLSEADNARQGFFEHADFEAVVAHLPEYLQDFTRFAYLTGWRKGEIASLKWADVDRDGCVIRLRPEASKNKEGRVVALEGDLSEILERRWRARQVAAANSGGKILAAHVFHLDGRLVGDFRKTWLAATKAAKVEGRLFHDLRRTAVRNLVRAGVPERVAMQISGHKTRHIFDRYNIVSETDLRNASAKMQAYLAAAPKERSVIPFPEAKEARR